MLVQVDGPIPGRHRGAGRQSGVHHRDGRPRGPGLADQQEALRGGVVQHDHGQVVRQLRHRADDHRPVAHREGVGVQEGGDRPVRAEHREHRRPDRGRGRDRGVLDHPVGEAAVDLVPGVQDLAPELRVGPVGAVVQRRGPGRLLPPQQFAPQLPLPLGQLPPGPDPLAPQQPDRVLRHRPEQRQAEEPGHGRQHDRGRQPGDQ